MTREYVPVDISNAPELKRLAEAVCQSGKPHALKEGAKTIAVVRPAPKKKGGTSSLRRTGTPRRSQVSATDDPALTQLFEEARRKNREVPMDLDALFAPPGPEEIARRKAVYEQIQQRRHERVIAPLTAADLIHEARAQEEEAYGFGR